MLKKTKRGLACARKPNKVFKKIRVEKAISEHQNLLTNDFLSKNEKQRLRKNLKILKDGLKELKKA